MDPYLMQLLYLVSREPTEKPAPPRSLFVGTSTFFRINTAIPREESSLLLFGAGGTDVVAAVLALLRFAVHDEG